MLKTIFITALLALCFSCAGTKVHRIGRITREIKVTPLVGTMSEASLVIKMLYEAQRNNCVTIRLMEITDGKVLGHCYYYSTH